MMKEDKTDNSVALLTDPQTVTACETTEAEEEKRRQQHKKRSKNWTRQETLRLIKLRSELEPRFAKSGRKSELWDEISGGLQREKISRDAQQCRDKWEKLTAGYKEVRDGVKSRHDNPFFDDLHPLLSARAKKESLTEYAAVTAAAAAAAAQPAVQENPEDDDGERTEEEEAATGKRRRCSYLTAEEVEEIVDNVLVRQQSFLREVVEAMERKEAVREQMRQEKEDRWRAEERAQRSALSNAVALLARKVEGGRERERERERGGKRRSKNWRRGEVLRLIKHRGEMEGRFVRSSRRAGLWEEVAERLGREGIGREGKQCREKWDKLVAEYREVADGKREQRDSPYFQDLTHILTPPPADVALLQQDQMDHAPL